MRLPKNPSLLELRAKIRSAKFRMKELDKAIDALAALERIQASERMTSARPTPTSGIGAGGYTLEVTFGDSDAPPRLPNPAGNGHRIESWEHEGSPQQSLRSERTVARQQRHTVS